jgi:hypothetical protein
VDAREIIVPNSQGLTKRAVKAMGKRSTIRPPGFGKGSKTWQYVLWEPFVGRHFIGKGVAQLQCFLEVRVLLSYLFCFVGIEYHLKGMSQLGPDPATIFVNFAARRVCDQFFGLGRLSKEASGLPVSLELPPFFFVPSSDVPIQRLD